MLVNYREDITALQQGGEEIAYFRRGQPFSVTRPDGTRTSYAYALLAGSTVYTVEKFEGTVANPSGNDDFLGTSYFGGSEDIEDLYISNKKHAKVHTNINQGGLPYAIFTSIADNDKYELAAEIAMSYDSASRLIKTRQRAWKSNTEAESTYNTLYEASYDGLRLDWSEDETGARTTYLVYDKQGRIEETIEEGGSAGIADIYVSYAYDGSNRKVGKFVMDDASTPEKVSSAWTYDKIGRLTSKTLDCCDTVNYEYPVVSSNQVKTINSDGGYVLEKYYEDGTLESRTGDAAAPLYVRSRVDSGRLERGTARESFSLGSTTGVDGWKVVRVDWLGRKVEVERPTGFEFDDGAGQYDFHKIYEVYAYNQKGQLAARHTRSSPTNGELLAPYRFEYNDLGQLEYEGSDVGDSGSLDTGSGSNDRITRIVASFVEDTETEHWWAQTETFVYPSTTEIRASTTKTQLAPLAGYLAKTIEIDSQNNETTTTVAVDRDLDKVTTTVDHPGVSGHTVTETRNGLLVSSSDPAGNTVTRTYDNLRRLQTVAGRDDIKKLFEYVDDSYRLYKANDVIPNGGGNLNYEIYTYDAHNRLQRLRRNNIHGNDPLQTEDTDYTYNEMGLIKTVRGNGASNLDYAYDSYGRVKGIKQYKSGATDPSEVKYDYDEETGLLKHKRHYKTASTYDEEDFEYNDLGAMSLRRFPDGKTISYTFSRGTASGTGDLTKTDYSDANTVDVVYNAYDRMGRPTKITDATGLREFTYGANSGLSLSLEDLNNTHYGSGNDISRYYEATGTGELKGRYDGLAYDGVDWDLEYDGASGRISKITGDRAGGSRDFSYTYAAHHVHKVSHGNYHHERYYEGWRENLWSVRGKWGSTHRSRFTWGGFSWQGQLDSYTLKYDANGISAMYGLSADTGYSLGYDSKGQLTAWQTSATTDASYTYDEAGNRETSDDINNSHSFGANDLNQLTGHDLAYDANGNLTADGDPADPDRWAYQYDGDNRLVAMYSVYENKSLKFKYDYMGRRVQKTVWNSDDWTGTIDSDVIFAYDGMKLIAEIDAASKSLIRTYHWGLDLSDTLDGAGGAMGLLMIEDWAESQSYYPAYDLSGNLVGLLEEDGDVAAWYEYDPFGNVIDSGGFDDGDSSDPSDDYSQDNPIGFSTQYTDRETGLVYYGHRYYHPRLGRFINRDPIGEQGGLNLYAFVGNNPATAVDVHGLSLADERPYPADDPLYQGNHATNPWATGDDEDVYELEPFTVVADPDDLVDNSLYEHQLNTIIDEVNSHIGFRQEIADYPIAPPDGYDDGRKQGTSPDKKKKDRKEKWDEKKCAALKARIRALMTMNTQAIKNLGKIIDHRYNLHLVNSIRHSIEGGFAVYSGGKAIVGIFRNMASRAGAASVNSGIAKGSSLVNSTTGKDTIVLQTDIEAAALRKATTIEAIKSWGTDVGGFGATLFLKRISDYFNNNDEAVQEADEYFSEIDAGITMRNIQIKGQIQSYSEHCD